MDEYPLPDIDMSFSDILLALAPNIILGIAFILYTLAADTWTTYLSGFCEPLLIYFNIHTWSP